MKAIVVYGSKSGIIRRLIVPNREWEPLDPDVLVKGEDFSVMDPVVDFKTDTIKTHVGKAIGKTKDQIPSGRCVVVDATNTVLDVIMADPDIDTHPDGTLILSDTAKKGGKV
jgi:hypothetical protein